MPFPHATVRFLPRTNLQTDYYHSVAISVLRGLAAFQVAAAHVRAMFYPGLSTLPDATMGYQLLAFCTGFAHQAVVIFFLLSGWLVGGSLLNRLDQPQVFLAYAIDRVTRLWIVLVPAFAVSLLVGIMIGEVDPGRPDLYSAGDYSLASFAANMFGLQDLAFPRYGGNFALWSLTYEIWYYVLFPLGVLVFAASGTYARAACAVALAFIAYHLNTAILLYFVLWLMGVGFSRIEVTLTAAARWALSAVFLLVAVWFRLSGSNDTLVEASFLQDLLYSLLFLLLLCSLQQRIHAPGATLLAVDRWGRWFAEFSFSLYVVHVPLLYLMRHLTVRVTGKARLDPASLSDFGVYVAMVVLVVLLAWLFHLPFEAQTYRLRRRAKELLLTRAEAQNIA